MRGEEAAAACCVRRVCRGSEQELLVADCAVAYAEAQGMHSRQEPQGGVCGSGLCLNACRGCWTPWLPHFLSSPSRLQRGHFSSFAFIVSSLLQCQRQSGGDGHQALSSPVLPHSQRLQ